MSKTWLYGMIIAIFFLAQFLIFSQLNGVISNIECPVKSALSIPCPLCGSISAVVHLYQGNIVAGLQSNPLGITLLFLGCIALILLIYDLVSGSSLLYHQYQKFEQLLSHNWAKVGLLMVIIFNWIWVIFQS